MPKNIKMVRKFNMYPTKISCACVIDFQIKRFTHLKKSLTYSNLRIHTNNFLQKIVFELSPKNVSHGDHDFGY